MCACVWGGGGGNGVAGSGAKESGILRVCVCDFFFPAGGGIWSRVTGARRVCVLRTKEAPGNAGCMSGWCLAHKKL